MNLRLRTQERFVESHHLARGLIVRQQLPRACHGLTACVSHNALVPRLTRDPTLQATYDMSVSEELREAREQRGLSLSDLTRITRVKGIILRALERGDADLLSPVEDIGLYLRAYAREVGL